MISTGAPVAPDVRSASSRWLRVGQQPWALVAGIAVLALGMLLANAPSEYIGDNRFEFFWAPVDLLVRHLAVWEPSRGLGRMRWDFWPATTSYLAALRGIGLSPAIAERVWHATLVTTGGVGAAFLLRWFRPRIGVEHWAAALLFAFGPFSALFLLPSNLYIGYCFAPWFLLVFLRGVTGGRPWRWAAVFALLVFVPGNMNYPALVFAVLPIAPAAAYLVLVERRVRWRDVAGWVARAAGLTLLVSAAALATTAYSAEINQENLLATETAVDISRASSWSESWRGFGFWLAYWSDSRGVVLPQFGSYFWAPVVAATFVAPVLAVGAVWRTRWRPRLLFAGMLVLGLTLMVGAFPVGQSSPYGRALLWLYERVPGVLALRSGHKAGAIVALGVAALAGVALAGLVRWALARSATRRPAFRDAAPGDARPARRSVLRLGTLAVVAGAIALSCYPFWSGRLFAPLEGTSGIPTYWTDATDWLNRQPGEGRVLVAPSTVDGVYRWGTTGGDDILEAKFERWLVAPGQISTWEGTAEAANAIAALDGYLNGQRYERGVIGPIARRLGIRFVVIRNDLDWRPIFRARPRSIQPLRTDPDLRLVRTFGRAGENVVEARFPSASERTLAPVEVYEVTSYAGLARATTAPPLVVLGDGGAWSGLALGGLFDRTGGVRYASATTDRELERRLRGGSAVVTTDTNRRRLNKIPLRDAPARGGATETRTEAISDRDRTLFPHADQQSVAWYADATRITATDHGLPQLPQPQHRPANAFDGDPLTAWRVSPLNSRSHRARVRFREPQVLRRVEIVGAPGIPSARYPDPFRVTRVSVELSDGTKIPVVLDGDRATVDLPAVPTRSLTVRITGATGSGFRPYGLAEVAVDGLDLRERIEVPTELVHRAEQDPSLRAALTRAPAVFQFGRTDRVDGVIVERALRRRFHTIGSREYEVWGRVERDRRNPSPTVDALLDDAATGRSECRDLGLTVDGAPLLVRADAPTIASTGPDPAEGPVASVGFVGCDRIALDSGVHDLDTGDDVLVRRVWLATDRPETGREGQIVDDRRGRASVDLAVTVPAPAWLMAGFSSDPTWQGTVGEHDARPPVTLDAQAAWPIDQAGTVEFAARSSAQRVYLGALLVTLGGLVLCVVLVVRGRFR